MNDPELSTKRREAVVEAYKSGVPKEDCWSWVQKRQAVRFEGHLLEATIEYVYD